MADESPAPDQRPVAHSDGSTTLVLDTSSDGALLQSLPVQLRGEVSRAHKPFRTILPSEDELRTLLTAAVLCGVRPSSSAGMARMLGCSRSTFVEWKSRYPIIGDILEAANEHLRTIVLSPLMREALTTDPTNIKDPKERDAAYRRRWKLAERLFEDLRPAPGVQINTQVNNNPPPVPQPMSRADYDQLVVDAHAARTQRLTHKPDDES